MLVLIEDVTLFLVLQEFEAGALIVLEGDDAQDLVMLSNEFHDTYRT